MRSTAAKDRDSSDVRNTRECRSRDAARPASRAPPRPSSKVRRLSGAQEPSRAHAHSRDAKEPRRKRRHDGLPHKGEAQSDNAEKRRRPSQPASAASVAIAVAAAAQPSVSGAGHMGQAGAMEARRGARCPGSKKRVSFADSVCIDAASVDRAAQKAAPPPSSGLVDAVSTCSEFRPPAHSAEPLTLMTLVPSKAASRLKRVDTHPVSAKEDMGAKEDKHDKHDKHHTHHTHHTHDTRIKHDKHDKYDKYDKYDKHDKRDKHDGEAKHDKGDDEAKERDVQPPICVLAPLPTRRSGIPREPTSLPSALPPWYQATLSFSFPGTLVRTSQGTVQPDAAAPGPNRPSVPAASVEPSAQGSSGSESGLAVPVAAAPSPQASASSCPDVPRSTQSGVPWAGDFVPGLPVLASQVSERTSTVSTEDSRRVPRCLVAHRYSDRWALFAVNAADLGAADSEAHKVHGAVYCDADQERLPHCVSEARVRRLEAQWAVQRLTAGAEALEVLQAIGERRVAASLPREYQGGAVRLYAESKAEAAVAESTVPGSADLAHLSFLLGQTLGSLVLWTPNAACECAVSGDTCRHGDCFCAWSMRHSVTRGVLPWTVSGQANAASEVSDCSFCQVRRVDIRRRYCDPKKQYRKRNVNCALVVRALLGRRSVLEAAAAEAEKLGVPRLRRVDSLLAALVPKDIKDTKESTETKETKEAKEAKEAKEPRPRGSASAPEYAGASSLATGMSKATIMATTAATDLFPAKDLCSAGQRDRPEDPPFLASQYQQFGAEIGAYRELDNLIQVSSRVLPLLGAKYLVDAAAKYVQWAIYTQVLGPVYQSSLFS